MTRTRPDVVSAIEAASRSENTSRAWAEVEVHGFAGDSQASGQDDATTGNAAKAGDEPWPGLLEVSWGNSRSDQVVPAEGELMAAKNPLQMEVQAPVGGVGPALAYLKERKRMFPGIKKMILVGRAVSGSSQSAGNWRSGDPAWTELRDAMNGVLEDYPEAVPVSIYHSMGTVDAIAHQTYSAETFLTDLTTAIADWRSTIHDGQNIAVVMPSIATFWTRRAFYYEDFQQALTKVAADDERIRIVPTRGLTSNDGDRHFTGPDYIALGQDAARLVAPLVEIPTVYNYRFQWSDVENKFVDLYGSGAEIYSQATVTDGTRGEVLTFAGTGMLTSALFNGAAYTFSAKIYPTATTGLRNYMGSKKSGDTFGVALSLAYTNGSLIHEGLSEAGQVLLTQLGSEPALNTWYTLAAVHNGTTATVYWDNAATATSGSNTVKPLDSARPFVIGAFDPEALSSNAFTGRMDDICLFSRPLSTAALTRLHNS